MGAKALTEDQLVVRRCFNVLKRLTNKGMIVGILRDTKNHMIRSLKRKNCKVVAIQIKEDFLLIKNLLLIGTITPVSQVEWRRTTPEGVPRYLSPAVRE